MVLRILVSALVFGIITSGAVMAAPAVTVNGQAVPYEEYVSALEMMSVSGPSGQQPAGAVVLERMVSEHLLIQLAEKEGVPVTDEQMERRLQSAKKDGLTPEVLRDRNLTEDQIKKGLRAQQAFVNLALKATEVTESEIRDFYFTNSQMYKHPLRVRIGAIITADKQKIDLASERLKKGEDFAAVAAELSDDPMTKAQGGALGWVFANQPGVPPVVTNTAIGLRVDAVSRPVKVQEQWVIIKAFERQKPTTTPIEDVKDTIRESLATERAMKSPDFQKKMQDFQRNTTIEIGVERFKSLGETLKSRVGQEPAMSDEK